MRLVLAVLATLFIGAAAMAQGNYQIRPGDVLSVEVLQDPTLNREVLVLPDGSISFPFAGTLGAAGLNTGQMESAISQGIARQFAVDPTVFVTVRQLTAAVPTTSTGPFVPSTIDIYFLGEVNDAGMVEVAPGTTFIQALSLSGGFTNFAAQRRIQLRRTDAHGAVSVVTIDYRAISRGASVSHDPVLADGDVILVPERRLFE